MVEFKRVLCPVDLSEQSLRPLAYAGAVAKWYGGQVTALHVVPTFEPIEVRASGLFAHAGIVAPMPREEVLERLQQALEAAGVPAAEARVTAAAGEAAATIVDQAVVMAADLLVLGTHGRGGFNHLLLGSVTEKVLRKAPCPVLTVPPHAPATPPAVVALRKILCPIDFSPASMQALGFSLDLARRANASVTFVHAIESLAEEEPREIAHFSIPEFRRELIEDARTRLEALIAQEAQPAAGHETRVVAGRAHREILRVATEEGAGLIVMGAQGRGGAALAAFGSTTQQVLRAAACPVLTVRGVRT